MSNTLDYAFFYPSQNKDRVYNATSFEYWLKKFFTTGVFEGELQVTANDDMTVTIASGYCNIDGKVRFFQNATILQLETANATYNRIDTVIAERNDTDRNITIKVVTGGYATEPLPTAPIRESGVHQLVLAQIYVAAGAVMITQEEITDTRTDQDLCGVVTGTVKEYNFDQFKAQFDKWFASVKDTLSEDAAGNLLKLMGELDSLETDAKDSLVSAINEVFNMAPETVDPMVTTESGFAADAKLTGDALGELNKNLEAQASNLESKIFQYRLLLASNLTIASTDETIVPLSNYWSSEADFQLNDDGTITYLGENPAYIMISASLYFYTGVINARKQVRLYRNSSAISTGNTYVNSQYTSLIVPTAVFDLKNGDTLKLCYTGSVNDVIGSNSNLTQISLIGYTSEYLANK